ncbi:MAG: CDP-diacylglycerol--serine O-phosphatidyltransferase [Cellvibrionaceae bacterium]
MPSFVGAHFAVANRKSNMTEPRSGKSQFQFYLVSIVTLGNLFFGLLSILLVASGQLTAGALCLIAGATLDAFDGSLARHWQVLSPFGAQLDSLADMVAFGVAISWLSWNWMLPKMPEWWLIIGIVSVLPGLMSAIRLARFNTSESNPLFFEGIPTTAMAGFVVLVYLTNVTLPVQPLLVIIALVSLLMVSIFPYPKLKYFFRFSWWWLLPISVLLIFKTGLGILVLGGIYMLWGPVKKLAKFA